MARVIEVNKSMKPLTCGRCQADLPKGSAYRHATPGFRGTRLVRCMEFDCRFRQSELTTSKMVDVYAAQEDATDAVEGWAGSEGTDELESILQECADRAREVAQEYADAADAMGEAGAEMQERADEIESWCDALECVEWPDLEEDDEPPTEDSEETLNDWVDECRQAAQDAIDELAI